MSLASEELLRKIYIHRKEMGGKGIAMDMTTEDLLKKALYARTGRCGIKNIFQRCSRGGSSSGQKDSTVSGRYTMIYA